MRLLAILVIALSISVARADGIRYVPGGDIEFCTTSVKSQSCRKIVDRKSLYDLSYIVMPASQISITKTWIEVRDSYSICAALNSSTFSCERLRLPLLEGMSIQTNVDRLNEPILSFTYSGNTSGIPVTSRRVLAQRYSEAIVEAATVVYSRLGHSPQSLKAVIGELPWKGTVVTQSCDDVTDPFRMDAAKSNDSNQTQGCFFDDYEIWYLNNFSGFGISFGTAQNPACVAQCTAAYDKSIAYCKTFPVARARAICYAASATKYGACLARC